MYYFKFLEPKSLREACELLSKYEGKAKLLAGGQSLVPLLKGGYIQPEYIIDLKNLKELDYVNRNATCIKIGAMTTHRTLETSSIIKKKFPVLVDAEHRVAHLQVRNWGTVGGALSHGDPGGDLIPPLIVLESKVKAVSIRGEREIPVDEFVVNIFTTVLEADEILKEITIPYFEPHSSAAYRKESIEEGDAPIASVAAAITLDESGKTIKKARLVLGAVGTTPIIAEKAAKAMLTKKADDKTAVEAGELAMKEADPAADVMGSVEYKQEIVRLLTRDMVLLAIKRAKQTNKGVMPNEAKP